MLWDTIAREVDREPAVLLTCACGATTNVTYGARFRFKCTGCGKPWGVDDVAAANIVAVRNHGKAEVAQLAEAVGAILALLADQLGGHDQVAQAVDRVALAAGPGPTARLMSGLERNRGHNDKRKPS